MTLHPRLLAAARACGSAALNPLVRQPSSPWFPAAVYVPVALACAAWNWLGESQPAWAWVALPPAGFLLWTLLEYVLHSQLFHEAPRGLRWLSESHGDHHDEPDDPDRIVARLAFSLPVALLLYAGLGLALWSPRRAALVMTGVIAGYLSYEVIHYAIHRAPWARRLLRPLVSHHLHHHHADPSRCYGVTSPLWDWVFRTGRKPRPASPSLAPSGAPRDR
jgi:sterol desaturase/sphingolipid hydroxylase (fatty acid hydroxylase superfamily)